MGLLTGYRVLDLCDERGLLAGRMFADLGADVVVVEPRSGSTARSQPPVRLIDGEERSLYWEAYAAGRRSVALDLDDEADRGLVLQLAGQADFLFESFSPGVLKPYGLDWAALQQVNPSLVYTSITAFGQTGPKAGYAATDLTVWAAGGPLDPHRPPDRPPVRIGIPQAFQLAAADAAGGALLAHHARRRTGTGQHVDVSAQVSAANATLSTVLAHAIGAPEVDWWAEPDAAKRPVDRSGSGSATPPDLKKWPVKDGMVEFHLAMGAATGGFTKNFFAWMAAEGEVDEDIAAWDWRVLPDRIIEGSVTNEDMQRARDATGRFLASKTMAEVMEAAIKFRLLCVGISDLGDLTRSPQLADRDFWVTLEDGGHQWKLPGAFAKVHGLDAFDFSRPAPSIGQHTEEVLTEWATPADSTLETTVGATR